MSYLPVSDLVSQISDDVVAKLNAAGYPPLTDGKILLGRQHVYEQSAPPRIIFTPIKSTFGPKDVYNRSNVSANQPYSQENLTQIANRSLLSDFMTYEVRCWGVTPQIVDATGAPDTNYDYTTILYKAVLGSIHLLTVGTYKVEGGTWTDSKVSASQLFIDGREFVFQVTFGTPILADLPQYQGPVIPTGAFAPTGTILQGTISETTPSGTEIGYSGPFQATGP